MRIPYGLPWGEGKCTTCGHPIRSHDSHGRVTTCSECECRWEGANPTITPNSEVQDSKREPEVVVVKLPLCVEAVAAIAHGLAEVWPASYVRPFDGPELHIVLDGPRVDVEYDYPEVDV